ncbi:VIT domain-containing protein, partial [Caulobacter sp. 17J65-9]|uniref:VIT domain-containing protein n=1 Tax=Caulobacter sp. 17J65-9 TaxID=2709382 RepID=UPI0013C895C7
MRRGWIGGLGLALGLAAAGSVLAAEAPPANPTLVAHDYVARDGGEARAQALRIDRLDVEVDLRGGLARTVVTARFLNPTRQPLEGDFELDLPAGSVVTGYALDVNGAMVDGVLVDRRKGTTAYEEKVRQGVDPGLAEVTRTGAFRTRVFPVMPEQGRTVRLEFVTPLTPDKGYALPLSTEPVGTTSLVVRTDRAAPVEARAPEGMALKWSRGQGGMEGRASSKGRPLTGGLWLAWAPASEPTTVARHKSGELFVEIDDAVGPLAARAARPERVRVYWDRSRSRRDDDLGAERLLLARYLEAVDPKSVDVVLFGDGRPSVTSYDALPEDAPQPAYDPRLSVRADAAVPRDPEDYRGATSLAGLSEIDAPRADVCLWFTDGNVTLEEADPKRGRCLTFTISSAADADAGFLSVLAGRSGGGHVDLRTTTPEAALSRMTRSGPRVVGVTDTAGRDLDYTVLPTGPDRVRLVARAPMSGEAVVVEVAGGAGPRDRVYRIDRASARPHDAAGALWG